MVGASRMGYRYNPFLIPVGFRRAYYFFLSAYRGYHSLIPPGNKTITMATAVNQRKRRPRGYLKTTVTVITVSYSAVGVRYYLFARSIVFTITALFRVILAVFSERGFNHATTSYKQTP